MASRILQHVEGMVPYEGKMKFKDPTSNVKITVEFNKPKPEGTFARLKGHFKKRDTKAQMQDDGPTGSLYDAGSYQNTPKRVSANRESYVRAMEGAYRYHPQQPGEGFSPLEDVPCPLDHGNREHRPVMPPPIPPRDRSRALHQVDPDYANEDGEFYEVYEVADMHRSTVQQQLNLLKQQEELNVLPLLPPLPPPPIPPRGSKSARNQEDSKNGCEIYTNQLTAQDQSLSNHQESSDAKKTMQANDNDSSDEDTYGEQFMKSYAKIQAKRAPGDNTTDADGYASVVPHTTEEYINCGFAPTSKNPPLPKQMWLTWMADGKEHRLPVNMAEREQAAET